MSPAMSDQVKQIVASIVMVRRGLLSDEFSAPADLIRLVVDTLNNIEQVALKTHIENLSPEQAHEVKVKLARRVGEMRRALLDTFRQCEPYMAGLKAELEARIRAGGIPPGATPDDLVEETAEVLEQLDTVVRGLAVEALDMFEHLLVGDPESEIQK